MTSIELPQSSPPQIDHRTDFPNGILKDMQLLIVWLFTDKCSIKLNSSRQLVIRIPCCINGAEWVFHAD
jgi:hypothetical protein